MPETKYLGEVPVDISQDPLYSTYTEKNWAMNIITSYGQIDGEHHKTWVIDQTARILLGTPVSVARASWSNGETEDRVTVEDPSSNYLSWRKQFREDVLEEDEVDDPNIDDEYDEGIPP